tara:strand:+ start:62 stop:604 length:543 start_codon:yes stop_codon:yes gene_type:complete
VKSDDELIRKALDGDNTSSSLLYTRYYTRVFRFVHNKVSDTATAQDIAQDALLAGLKHLRTYKGNSSFYTWLCTIAINKVKKQRSHNIPFNGDTVTNSTPETVLSSKETVNLIISSFKELSKLQQAALFYQIYEQLTIKEIADILQCSPRYTKNLVSQAKQIIRPLLKEKFNEIKSTKRA